jgi:hypothetical protein
VFHPGPQFPLDRGLPAGDGAGPRPQDDGVGAELLDAEDLGLVHDPVGPLVVLGEVAGGLDDRFLGPLEVGLLGDADV